MDYTYACLGGIVAKVYDDLSDNDLLDPLVGEILKGCFWILLTLLSYNDFNFSVLNYGVNALNAYSNPSGYKDPYETTLLILAPFFILISYSTAFFPSVKDLMYILTFVVGMFLEPLFVTEEFSFRKLLMRVFFCISSVVWVIVGVYMGVAPSYIKLLCFGIGYFFVSAGFQAYLLTARKV
jgi:hypothetical protein